MPKTVGAHASACNQEGETARKNFPQFMPHNALKSLDSDERIQGNPRKSNARKQGLSQQNGDKPRKSKQIDRRPSRA
jgi:hypothetical protein